MSRSDWKPVSPSKRCKVCRSPKRCAVSADGAVAKCTYVFDGPTAFKSGDDEVGQWAMHRLDGSTPIIPSSRGPQQHSPVTPDALLADVPTRDAVYRALITACPLSADHREGLLRRGLDAPSVEARGYATLAHGAGARARVVAQLRGLLGGDSSIPDGIPGLYRGDLPDGIAGMLVPVRDLTGAIVAMKVRRDGARDPRYLWLSSSSAGGASSGAPSHVPLGVAEHVAAARIASATGARPEVVVRITEGELKADIAFALSGVPTLSIPGAGAWRSAVDHLRALHPDVVRLAWDADARTNEHVAAALETAAIRYAQELPGVALELETWDAATGKGVDDVLMAGPGGGELTLHRGADLWREVVAILNSAGVDPRPETLAHVGVVAVPSVVDIARAPDAFDPDWQSALITNNRGAVKPGIANTVTILSESPRWHGRIAWNSKQQTIFLDGRPLHDGDIVEARVSIEREFGYDPGNNDTWSAFRAAAQEHVINPVADYLSALRWDGIHRLDTVAERHLGARQRLAARMVRMFMISAVARALSPGCKVDTVLVLIGDQSMRKSTFVRCLASDAWFSDSHVDLTSKDAFLQFGHAWILEWGEIERIMQRHDAAFTKTLIPSLYDDFRPPFGRTMIRVPRSCLFVGTTNQRQFLNDETGDRRYWCVEIAREIDIAALVAERDQLWAEAVEAFRAGEQWWFDRAGDQQRAAAAGVHAVDDPWLDVVSQWIDTTGRTDFRSQEILAGALQIPLERQQGEVSRHLGRVMRRLGYRLSAWRPVRNGQRLKVTKCWVPDHVAAVVASARITAAEAIEDGRVPGHGDAYEGPTRELDPDEIAVDTAMGYRAGAHDFDPSLSPHGEPSRAADDHHETLTPGDRGAAVNHPGWEGFDHAPS